MSKTIIISNRLPLQLKIDNDSIEATPSVGGLATGMKSVHSDSDGIWIGWSGLTEDCLTPQLHKKVNQTLKEHQCSGVALSQEELDGYYFGFSNDTLWPLFHYFMEYTRFERDTWEMYQKVNQKFADKVIETYKDGDTIWVHDYQLLLVPQLVRNQIPEATIGFFLHIPFPSYEVFRTIPYRKELLEGLLGSNLIGFHTYDYERHFLSATQRILGHEINFNTVQLENRNVVVDSFPMGIDYQKFHKAAISHDKKDKKNKSEVQQEIDKHLKEGSKAKLILSIDRLDYTKGIANRLRAFEYFLEKYPQFKGKARLVMLAVPSRSDVPQYQLLKNEIDQLVGRINGRFAEVSWTPIWYFYRSMPFENLIDLYTSSEVALLTPIRDGMNLVAKEYVAARVDKKGVLILSEMTGASKEMSEALIINPNNFEEIADTIKYALEMPVEEQIKRNSAMQKRLQRYDVERWASDFMEALELTQQHEKQIALKKLNTTIKNHMFSDFKKAKQRILFLDYDGTLAPFQKIPEHAKPTEELYTILDAIYELPDTKLIIITGRDKDTFNKWFGHKPYTLITEHGAWLRETGKDWELMEAVGNKWFEVIAPILETFTDRTPGSIIEEKNYSLAWHYRNVDPDLARKRAVEVKTTIQHLIANHNLEIMDGDKVLEIKAGGVNKGKSATKMLMNTDYEFIFAIGDDWTDEFMFKELPESTYTIKVGFKKTKAKYYVEGTKEVHQLLKDFASAL
ncbi:bifunctional alpha,alpha-trehalose-phosphate synthase (UDP-forming)/trehalose-phosphatase [Aquimarina sp. ERC-38]|uniref:bifunctional alpha,alpha-trehalose-phosphate synthase (UDP-forming)/trehalose-phosphatase n=1 Tax=Aquimarina sp. ERC-38 TaxID=2949996 RepID=UPI0022464222|nr:bifunctional alpha,alpha-trehalose-phosphate synthase (UDP-forming)/trehalose-phosphatase [Aquimarina sp. ERC-38]UZO79994.1 bifunctional alpha,alpha-trehalose-phosphate synthase (UDP-forming)/trehalose-phosphatase [Aquimarina sp. ERC-38]